MCHRSCIKFGERNLSRADVEGKHILEVGSRNVNGSLRAYIENMSPASYVGVDIISGDGVDVIGDICNLEGYEVDLLICTEVLEHVHDWRAAISNLKGALKPNGTLLLTTRSKGFPQHDFPSDFWRFEIEDMQAIFSDLNIEVLESDAQVPGVFIKAQKQEGFSECDLSDYDVCAVPGSSFTSIIIPAHNLWDQTKQCLDSIAEHTTSPHEIIVVDNGSTDGAADGLQEYQNVQVITSAHNQGYAASCNQGITVARGNFIVLLNNDTVVSPGWLAGLLDVFRDYPKTGIVGPMSDYVGNKAQQAKGPVQHSKKSILTINVMGFCMAIRRDVIDTVGLLDEQFINAYEDIEFCLRTGATGFECRVAQNVFIHHKGSQTFKITHREEDYWRNMKDNWKRIEEKWPGRVPAPVNVNMLRYLVTGTGRSGTGFMANVLTGAGVPCGHEGVFSYGGDYSVPDGIEAESSWMAAPYLADIKDTVKLHLVRHPQHVIESLLRTRFFEIENYAGFAKRWIPEVWEHEDLTERAAAFYIAWNKLIEKNGHDARWRVEDDAGGCLEKLGIEYSGKAYWNQRYNTAIGERVSVDLHSLPDELFAELDEMCGRYGYDIDAPVCPPPKVYWSVLLERSVDNHAVAALLEVAVVAGINRFVRIGTLYSRTDSARNLIVDTFRQLSRNPDDTLIMLDCDHTHPPDILERLSQRKEGVVGALAFRRSAPFEPMFYLRGNNGRLNKPADFEKVVYECAAVGTAAIAIKRWVFDKLQAAGHNYFFRYVYSETSWQSSEDMYFAKLCEDNGIKHHVDCSLETPHLRVEFVDRNKWDEYRASHPERVKYVTEEVGQ